MLGSSSVASLTIMERLASDTVTNSPINSPSARISVTSPAHRSPFSPKGQDGQAKPKSFDIPDKAESACKFGNQVVGMNKLNAAGESTIADVRDRQGSIPVFEDSSPVVDCRTESPFPTTMNLGSSSFPQTDMQALSLASSSPPNASRVGIQSDTLHLLASTDSIPPLDLALSSFQAADSSNDATVAAMPQVHRLKSILGWKVDDRRDLSNATGAADNWTVIRSESTGDVHEVKVHDELELGAPAAPADRWTVIRSGSTDDVHEVRVHDELELSDPAAPANRWTVIRSESTGDVHEVKVHDEPEFGKPTAFEDRDSGQSPLSTPCVPLLNLPQSHQLVDPALSLTNVVALSPADAASHSVASLPPYAAPPHPTPAWRAPFFAIFTAFVAFRTAVVGMLSRQSNPSAYNTATVMPVAGGLATAPIGVVDAGEMFRGLYLAYKDRAKVRKTLRANMAATHAYQAEADKEKIAKRKERAQSRAGINQAPTPSPATGRSKKDAAAYLVTLDSLRRSSEAKSKLRYAGAGALNDGLLQTVSAIVSSVKNSIAIHNGQSVGSLALAAKTAIGFGIVLPILGFLSGALNAIIGHFEQKKARKDRQISKGALERMESLQIADTETLSLSGLGQLASQVAVKDAPRDSSGNDLPSRSEVDNEASRKNKMLELQLGNSKGADHVSNVYGVMGRVFREAQKAGIKKAKYDERSGTWKKWTGGGGAIAGTVALVTGFFAASAATGGIAAGVIGLSLGVLYLGRTVKYFRSARKEEKEAAKADQIARKEAEEVFAVADAKPSALEQIETLERHLLEKENKYVATRLLINSLKAREEDSSPQEDAMTPLNLRRKMATRFLMPVGMLPTEIRAVKDMLSLSKGPADVNPHLPIQEDEAEVKRELDQLVGLATLYFKQIGLKSSVVKSKLEEVALKADTDKNCVRDLRQLIAEAIVASHLSGDMTRHRAPARKKIAELAGAS